MRWKFIITNLFSGCLQGTNDQAVAAIYAANEDFFVADVEAGTWLTPGTDTEGLESLVIQEIETPTTAEGADADADSEDD